MQAGSFVLAPALAILGLTVSNAASACSPAPESLERPPPSLKETLSSNPIVFVGVVIADGSQEDEMAAGGPRRDTGARYATFKIEIPLKGTFGVETIKVRNRGGGDCFYGFAVGERWFFAGSTGGALYSIWSGSTLLADEKGDIPEKDQSDHEKALRKALPEIRKLPPPVPAKSRPE